MKMINERFDGANLGVRSWIDFIYEAAAKGLIGYTETASDIVLTTSAKATESDQVFKILLDKMKALSPGNDWITFTRINKALLDQKIRIEDFGFTKFKKLAIEAESRNLLEIKNEGLKWSAKRRNLASSST